MEVGAGSLAGSPGVLVSKVIVFKKKEVSTFQTIIYYNFTLQAAMGGPAFGIYSMSIGVTRFFLKGRSRHYYCLVVRKTHSSMKNRLRHFPGTLAIVMALTLSWHFASAQCTSPPNKPGTIMGTKNVCPDESVVYKIKSVATADTYTWVLPAGVTISGMNPYTSADTMVTIDYGPAFSPPDVIGVYATNPCGNSATKTANVSGYSPSKPSSIQGPSTACNGDTLNYTVTQVQQNSYMWSVPASMSIASGQGTNSVMIAFNAGFTNNGTMTVTTTNGCGNTSAARPRKIFKGNAPAAPDSVMGPEVACPGETKTYSVDSLDNATTNWTVPTGATILSGQGTTSIDVLFPAGFVQGPVACQYVDNCGTSPFTDVNVRATPTIPGLISGPVSGVCNATLTYSVAPILGATNYTWTAPPGATVVSGQGTNVVDIMFPAVVVNDTVKVNATNACGTSANRKLIVNGDIVITQHPASGAVCEGDTTMLSVTAPGGNLSYQWRLDGMNLSDGADYSGTTTATLTILAADSLPGGSGNYDVIVSSTCAPDDTSNAAVLTVNMRPPVPGVITAPSVICPGATSVPLSVAAGGYNTTGHFWQILNNGTITGGQGTNAITADFFATPFSGYTILCWATNGCGMSIDTSSKWVRYNISTPVITSGSIAVCQGETGLVYTINPIGGATSYNWTVTPDITIAGGQGTVSMTADFSPTFTSGQICVTAMNSCVTTPQDCRNVVWNVPATPAPITGDGNGACNTTLPYSIGTIPGAASYDWTLPSGATISSGAGTASVMIDFSGVINGQVCVAAVGNCTTGGYRCKKVKSNPVKPASITPSTGTFCAFQTGITFTAATSPGATGYLWTVPPGASITAGAGTNVITVDLGASSGQVGVRAENACNKSGTKTFDVNITCRGQAAGLAAEAGFSIQARPNPVAEELVVDINGLAGNYELVLTDVVGKVVMSRNVQLSDGINQLRFDVQSLKSGIYLLTARIGDDVNKVRLIKQ